MNTLVCCMKQKNGKVKTENYPPPPRSSHLSQGDKVNGKRTCGA